MKLCKLLLFIRVRCQDVSNTSIMLHGNDVRSLLAYSTFFDVTIIISADKEKL